MVWKAGEFSPPRALLQLTGRCQSKPPCGKEREEGGIPMAILITGGTGFLGRHLTRHLLQSGEKDLVLLDAVPNMAAIAEVAAQVKMVQGDVMEVTALIDTIKKYSIEGIIHLAYFLGTGGMRNPLPAINI